MIKSPIKSSYIAIGSALMLCACSQEAEIPVAAGAGEPIMFKTSLPAVTSRALIRTERNLPYFHVTAFNPADPKLVLFDNELVTIQPGASKHFSLNCMWPAQGRESDVVTFFAYYPALNTGADLEDNTTVSGGNATFDYKLTGFRVEPQIAEQEDFVTAYTTGTTAENLFSGITLPFHHQLSRIEVKAWSANKSCDIEIAGVRIGGIGVEGTFAFMPTATGGEWYGAPTERGTVEYIYGTDDVIVTLNNRESTSDDAVSIMGHKNGDDDNCAMIIPADYAKGWDFATDSCNADKNMYISVLLRVTDITPTAGKDPEEPQRFPYKDLSQGADAKDIPVVSLAVDKATGAITRRLYKSGDSYYTDEATTDLCTPLDTEEIKDFGWAALPVTGNLAPGNIYTYTLDYTSGVGLHDPEVETSSPAAGNPIISDKVGFTCTVKGWNDGGGEEFIVPGS